MPTATPPTDANPKVDAVWISNNFVGGSDRLPETVRRIAGKLFGMKPGEPGKTLTYHRGIEGGTAIRPVNDGGGYYDTTTQRPLYQWTDVPGRDGLVRVGTLIAPVDSVDSVKEAD